MRAIGRAAAVTAIAVALLVAGAAVFVRGTGVAVDPAARHTSSSALLLPTANAGSLDGEIASLQQRLREIPDDWRGFAQLGLAYVAQARVTADPSWYPKAEGVLRRSLRLQPAENVDGALGIGALDLARHDFAAALREGRRASDLNPYSADAYGVIGDALLELGRYDRAFEAFQTMVDTRPDLASYARVAYARELVGDVSGAEHAMRMAFDAAGTPSDSAWTAYQLGELAFGSGDVGSARGWYARGLDLDPAYVPNLAGLAKVAWARGDDELAIARFTEVVARYPSAEFIVALADLYRASGQPALADRQEAVVAAMHDLTTANGVNVDLELALFDAEHGDPEGALAAARAEWARRQSVHVADAYAWALYANGRYQRASAFADRALELGTRNALFLFHAGMIRLELGDEFGARRYLSRALATNPNFSILHADDAARVLSRLGTATLEPER
ncbi:MAG TPA: tetratricopeptide repeat protein [Actinomycetota bacterium]